MSDIIKLFESILGKKPDAFLHEPVYQVTESEVAEFARAALAQEAGRQEPIAVVHECGWTEYDLGQPLKPGDRLYLHPYSPPAPVSVVLPERADENDDAEGNDPLCWYSQGWNACLDKLKELNQ